MREAVDGGLTNSITGFALSTGFALGTGAEIGEALRQGGQGALMGLGIGVIGGAVKGFEDARDNDLNWQNGKFKGLDARELGLESTLKRINAGLKYPHDNDGSIFENKENFLPKASEGYYKEYVHPTLGTKGAGPQRIVIGKKGEIYYTPDHYKTFMKIKY